MGGRKWEKEEIYVARVSSVVILLKRNFLYFSIGSDLLREQLEEPLKKFNIQYKRLSTIVIR